MAENRWSARVFFNYYLKEDWGGGEWGNFRELKGWGSRVGGGLLVQWRFE